MFCTHKPSLKHSNCETLAKFYKFKLFQLNFSCILCKVPTWHNLLRQVLTIYLSDGETFWQIWFRDFLREGQSEIFLNFRKITMVGYMMQTIINGKAEKKAG